MNESILKIIHCLERPSDSHFQPDCAQWTAKKQWRRVPERRFVCLRRKWWHPCVEPRPAPANTHLHHGRKAQKVTHNFTPTSGRICINSFFSRLQDIIGEIAQQERNFKILIYANGFKKIRITEKIVKELKIDTFAYERTSVGRRRRAMKEKVYYSNFLSRWKKKMFKLKILRF